jgi:two-component system cell cycle sensor histidine kinase/response regulator CckA
VVSAELQEVRQAAERASQLTQQLLAFSRHQVLKPELVDPSRVVLEMHKLLRSLLGAQVELTLRGCEPPALIYVDPSQLAQVVMNLAVNARDAMPSGGKLTIELTAVELRDSAASPQQEVSPGAYVLLQVTDSGLGMDASTRERIFEPFFTTKAPGKGTGFGLATVYGIVAQSGGHVRVDSELGRGTTFRVYFPRPERASALAR